jgi:hypothetical protein
MNKIIPMLVFMFAACQLMAADDYVGTYNCKATALRTDMAMSVDGYLELMVYKEGDSRVLRKAFGHIKAEDYYGIFSFDKISNNSSYKPTKYKDSVQFKDFDAIQTSSNEGMWGELVISKELPQKEFVAHYIFKAGDHLGGTVDFSCKNVLQY